MQGDKPHTSCVGSLSLVRQGSIPKAHFFFSVKQGLKYCMQEIAFLGACVTRKFSLCIKIESCHVPATQTRMHLLLKQALCITLSPTSPFVEFFSQSFIPNSHI